MGKQISKSSTGSSSSDQLRSVYRPPRTSEKNHGVSPTPTIESPRLLENSILIWLDQSLAQLDEKNKNTFEHLQTIADVVEVFSDMAKCVNYLKSLSDVTVFLIVSGSFGPELLPQIQHLSVIQSIYVFCGNKAFHLEWSKVYSKVHGVCNNAKELCELLRRDIQRYDSTLTPISILTNAETDKEFIYFILMKNLLLDISYNKQDQQALVQFVRPFFLNNSRQLNLVDGWKESYAHHSPLWWYTRKCFMYYLLRRAFLHNDLELIYRAAFFIRDLHREIKKYYLDNHHHRQSEMTIMYRTAPVTEAQWKVLSNSTDGLLTFNDFLWTNFNRPIALKFAQRLRESANSSIIVIYRIELDPLESSIPYVALKNLSYWGSNDDEVLFSMNTVFRIQQIKPLSQRLHEVYLQPVTKKHPLASALLQCVQETSADASDWYRLSRILMKLKDYQQLAKIYQFLESRCQDKDKQERAFLQHELGYLSQLQGQPIQAIERYNQSIKTTLMFSSPSDPSLFPTYLNLGSALRESDNLVGALEQYQRTLQLNPSTDLTKIELNLRIGSILQEQKKSSEAKEFYKTAENLIVTRCPTALSLLSETYHHMADLFYSSGDYSNALAMSGKALKLNEKLYPSGDSTYSSRYRQLAMIYKGLKDSSTARSYAKKAVDIARQSYGEDDNETKENLRYFNSLTNEEKEEDESF